MQLAAQDAKPELRPKRPIYQNYNEIVRTLTAAANSRIKASRNPADPKIEKITPEMRRLQAVIVDCRRKLKAAESELVNKHQAQVEHGGALALSWSEVKRLRDLPERGYQSRLSVVRQLGVRAILDTVDMTPTQAKKYLLALERRLSTV